MTAPNDYFIIQSMADPLLEKIIDPLVFGEPYLKAWKAAPAGPQGNDILQISLLIKNDTDRDITLVISPRDAGSPCYERTPSFNISFFTEADKDKPLSKEEEEALIYVIEAVRMNDHGRYYIEFDENKASILRETPQKPTIMTKILDKLFPPRKKEETSPTEEKNFSETKPPEADS